jgi:uncharacterized protein YabN with tetrapyrrole methylase and pyrophosphatase domain
MQGEAGPPPRAGSLTVVGTGIALGQVTAQALGALREADVVLAVIPDAAAMAHVAGICGEFVSLLPTYQLGRPRSETYTEMAERVMARVREGRQVCFALYGHPGVLSMPAHIAMQTAREEGYPAEMLPGISADACIFADLGVDPGDDGVQSYVAEQFLRGKVWDPSTPLILWQVGAVGEAEYCLEYSNLRLPELIERLVAVYGGSYEVVIYEAATLPMQVPRIERISLDELATARLTTLSTLFVPPIA